MDLKLLIEESYKKIREDPTTIPKYNPFESLKVLGQMAEVKLVIIGQDPYNSGVTEGGRFKDYHDGLAFSSKNTIKTPPPLRILHEWFRQADHSNKLQVGEVQNDLRYLLERKVFLMNALWTSSTKKAGSHMFPEYYYIDDVVLKYIISKNPDCRFLLLGAKAGLLRYTLKESNVQFIEDIHPSAEKYTDKEYRGGLSAISKGLGIRFTI